MQISVTRRIHAIVNAKQFCGTIVVSTMSEKEINNALQKYSFTLMLLIIF
jgi:hypothetical protein